MNTMKNYPMSLTRLANKFGMSRDNILYFLDKDMGYVNGIREITEKGKENGVSYAYCRVDECEYDYSKRYVVYDASVQDLICRNRDHINSLDAESVKKYAQNDRIIGLVKAGVLI